MNRQEYEAYKKTLIDGGFKFIDRVLPEAAIPELLVEEITAFILTEDKFWHSPSGKLVSFGKAEGKKSLIFHPSFAAMVANAAGITMDHPEIEKQRSKFPVTTPSGRVIEYTYVSRVVGRITFHTLNQSGTPVSIAYTTERDIDALFDEEKIKDMEKIGASDGRGGIITEENTRYCTGNEARDSLNSYKKLLEMSHHAYQTVDTKLRGHGVEKAMGIPAITEDYLGGVLIICRISYNAENPDIKKLLALGAVQSMIGATPVGRKLLAEVGVSDTSASTPTTTVTDDDDMENVTGETTPATEPEAQQPSPQHAPAAAQRPQPQAAPDVRDLTLSEEVIEWSNTETLSDPRIKAFVIACVELQESDAVLQWIINAYKNAADGFDGDAAVDMIGAAKNTRYMLSNPKYDEAAARLDESCAEATYSAEAVYKNLQWITSRMRSQK